MKGNFFLILYIILQKHKEFKLNNLKFAKVNGLKFDTGLKRNERHLKPDAIRHLLKFIILRVKRILNKG